MRRALAIMGIAFATLLVAVAVVYAFGAPQAPEQSAAQSSVSAPTNGGAPGGMAGAGASVDPNAEAPPPDPNTPLAIEIPGCVCHSDDPAVVEQHAQYRMNQCAGCHMGGVPTGQ